MKCKHLEICGGCSFKESDYSLQLFSKEKKVCDAFGKETLPIIPSEKIFQYRNKMEFSFSENKKGERFLGLVIGGSRGHVFHLEECHLVSPWFAETLCRVRTWWHDSDLHAYFPPGDRGSLRTLTMRESSEGRMVILTVSGNPEYALKNEHLDSFKKVIGEGVSTFLRIQQIQKGSPTRFFEMHLQGPDHITETMLGLKFKISPASFFQPNTKAAEVLYQTALSFVPEGALLYDLYCGTGTLGIAAAKRARQVIGIELSPEAVLDAEENAKRNNISNITFYQGDVGKVLATLNNTPDVVIVDPPRIGLDKAALEHLKALRPKMIIYVSCNPLSQAANIKELSLYHLEILQPLDQFPHTHHIENIAILRAK